MRQEPDDAVLDGLALVTAAHNGDWQGAKAVLGNADTTAVAGFLARLSADLLSDWIEDDPEFLVRMRDHYTERP